MRGLKPWLLSAAALVIAVVAYNTWSVCRGLCACENLLRLNFVTGGLLAGNGVALAALVFLKRGRDGERNVAMCHCGQVLENGWRFCGGCGQALAPNAQGAEKI